MITSILSFFGGTAFRLIFGSVMDYLRKKQEHGQEVEMMKIQADLDKARHEQKQAEIRLLSEMNVRELQVAGDVEEMKTMASAFLEASKATSKPTGVKWVDAWNGAIRPAGATVSIIMWVAAVVFEAITLNQFDQGLIGAFLGIFVGERIHAKLKK